MKVNGDKGKGSELLSTADVVVLIIGAIGGGIVIKNAFLNVEANHQGKLGQVIL